MMSWQVPTNNYDLQDRGYEAPRSYQEPSLVNSNNNQYVTYLKEESNEGVRTSLIRLLGAIQIKSGGTLTFLAFLTASSKLLKENKSCV